jgi:hypothetical protein
MDARLGPNIAGGPSPAPAIQAAGNNVWLSTITRYTFANGGANTGGAGTFTTY